VSRRARVDFDDLPWDTGSPGIRSKSVSRDGRQIRLVELEGNDREHDWCVTGHVGYVLEGELEIAFEDRTERFASGTGFIIRPGEGERHRPKAISPRVVLLLVEDG
jgi:hypothetical protein